MHEANIRSLFCVISLLLLQAACNRPTDSVLRRNFQVHRREFELVVAMAKADSVVERIGYPSGRVPPELSASRWSEYHSLLSEIGATNGLLRRSDFPGVIFLVGDCEGSAVSKDCKGYAFSETTLTPLRGNLDGLDPGVAFEVVDRNWYLFRDGG